MKKILLFISLLLFTGIAFSQTRKYFERLNANLTIDSGYVKIVGDSVFNYSGDTFICRTKQFYDQFYNPDYPNGFANFHLDADNIYRNFTPKAQAVDWTGINNNPGTTVGAGLYSLATPATASLIRINADGSVLTRTAIEAKQDLNIDQVNNTSDANKPISTATQTALNSKQAVGNYATLTGSETITNKTFGMFNFGLDAQPNDSYVITLNPAPTSYTTGMIVIFKANTQNTTACSINVNGLGVKSIVKRVSTTPATGDILAGMFCFLIYDGTNFVILNPVVN